jgi:GT2 family glycosyltransferase
VTRPEHRARGKQRYSRRAEFGKKYTLPKHIEENRIDASDFPSISVIIAAFTMDRWDMLREAVSSVQAQTREVLETIVVIDHNPALLARVQDEIPGVTVVQNIASQGASGTRNSGVALSKGEIIAFLDDDAIAHPDWLEMLLRHFGNPQVVGVGGKIIPLWEGPRPHWFPYEFDWAIGASYLGMPEQATPVRNVWSGNMAIRRQTLDAIEGFRVGFGKLRGRSRPEDTDLCLRAATVSPGGLWIYEPASIVDHHVPAKRATLSYFLHRCLDEGMGKAALAALNDANQSTSAERYYARHVLPQGVIRGLRDVVRGDASGCVRSFAIMAGLSCAATGFLAGRVTGAAHPAVLSDAQSAGDSGQVRSKGKRGANAR